MDENIRIVSFNVNGLRLKQKRIAILEKLRSLNAIILLQETHSHPDVESEWRNDWGGNILFSHGTSNSRGTAILMPNQMNYDILEETKDSNGRFIGIKVKINDDEYCIFNAYAPTLDKKNEQIIFAGYMQDVISQYESDSVIMGGDYNLYMNPELDKKGTMPPSYDNIIYRHEMSALLDSLHLVDAWRVYNPGVKRYTWHARGKASRLDYLFVSEHLMNNVSSCSINPGLHSDHSIIQISFSSSFSQKRGRGLWKFNTLLLHDKEYVDLVKKNITKGKSKYAGMQDKGLKWDLIKSDIRALTIPYCIRKKKESTKLRQDLEKKLEQLYKEFDKNEEPPESSDLTNEINIVQTELETLDIMKAKSSIFRSKIQWSEDGEKNSQYFLSLEKRNYTNKLITQLNVDGINITDPEKILHAEKQFYENLYKDNIDTQSDEYKLATSYFTSEHEKPVLDEVDKLFCDTDISENEVLKSLKLLKNGRTPGSDGFPPDFYKFFWYDIKDLVFESLTYALDNGKLSIEQRRGILTLIPKKNKIRILLKNWRPISLLNTDYKILAKLFAERLKKVLPRIISQDQTGYLKGRYIGQNIRLIDDVLFFTDKEIKPGIMMAIDFEKAFDSLNWKFLDNVLQYYNFGNKFRSYIGVIYNDITSGVTNNGHVSEFFKLERGVRQGCPLSAYLFILAVEILAHKVRKHKHVKGIKVGERYIKISQLADDTTIFLEDVSSIEHVLTIFHTFSRCAGLKINIDKTNAMYIGSLRTSDYFPHGLSWIKDSLSTLGVVFTPNPEDSYKFNFHSRITKMKNLLKIWKQRKLSFKGKVTVLNTLAISPLVYISSVIDTPQKAINEVEKIILDFFWDGKKPKVAKCVLFQKIENGGLKLCDFSTKVKALKASWIKRLACGSNDTWKLLPQHFYNIDDLNLFFKIKGSPYCQENIPLFYQDIHNIWMSMYAEEPASMTELQNEVLWWNKYITQSGVPICWDEWINKGIYYIRDLLDEQGQFLNHIQLYEKYGINCNFLQVLQIRQCLPSHWRQNIYRCNKKLQENSNLCVKIDNRLKMIDVLKCKDFYWYFIDKEKSTPRCQTKWCESFPELKDVDDSVWERIYKMPYIVSRETKLQSFHFRVVHRILPCNKWLCDITILDTNICNFCDNIDTIQHFLYECNCLKLFWQNFFRWWNRISPVKIENIVNINELRECILFGFPGDEDIIVALNYCTLMAKYYIYIQKLVKQNSPTDFYDFLVYIKSKLKTELFVCIKENKLHKFDKFSFIYELL